MAFSLTEKQIAANAMLAGPATHVMLFGGSRSGKTFLIVRALAVRALKAPMSRHAMLRYRLGHIKQSVVLDTFPKVMKLCFPKVEYQLHTADLYATIDTGTEPSELWFGGLDDKDRVEKILGNEYATLAFNECSQIPWASRNMAITRLAQAANQRVIIDGKEVIKPLRLKAYYDENPPDKGHWTYRLFIQKLDPEERTPLPYPEDFASMQINPGDNRENLGTGYLDTLKGLSTRLQRRFLLGEFRDANPYALFSDEMFDRMRVIDTELPDMQRIVIAVDPSGSDDSDNLDNDEIGIVVAGLGIDGNGYLLEDLTCKTGPAGWGRVVSNAYDRHEADRVVAEMNFGGAMVKQVIQSARRGQAPVPFTAVTASRGKVVRAEPISALVEQGRIRHVGYFHKLEEELTAFTTTGYLGENSPNRADAYVWAFASLFPAIAKPESKPKQQTQRRAAQPLPQGWMA